MYKFNTLQEIDTIIRCFNEIEEFSLTRDTQIKLIKALRNSLKTQNKYKVEINKYKKG